MPSLIKAFSHSPTLSLSFSAIAALIATAGPARAGIVTRTQEAVVRTGDMFPAFAGVPVDRIVLYTWDATTSSLIEIPTQVDEREAQNLKANQSSACQYTNDPCELGYVLSGVEPSPGSGLDDDDEVVFMARDATGSAAPISAWIGVAGVDTMATRYQISVRDAVNGEVGYVYAFAWLGTPTHQPGVADYVQWTAAGSGEPCQTTGDPACGWAESTGQGSQAGLARFKIFFSGNWTISATCVEPLPAGQSCTVSNNASNMLDKAKVRTEIPTETEWGWDESQCRAFLGVKDGPVRVIRWIQGALSGRYTTKTERFYGTWLDQLHNLRVHPIGSVRLSNDHRSLSDTSPSDGQAFTFTESHSVANNNDPMDAIDASPPATATGGPDDWIQVNLSRGTYIHYVESLRGLASATRTFHYDDKIPGGSREEQQAFKFGQSGFKWEGDPCLPNFEGDDCDLVFGDDPEDPDLSFARFTRTLIPLPVDSGPPYKSEEGEDYGDYRNQPLVTVPCSQTPTTNSCPTGPPQCPPILSGSSSPDGFRNDLVLDVDACESEVAGTQLYRGFAPGVYSFLADLGIDLSFRDFKVKDGTTYRYVARAYDSGGNLGPLSEELALTVEDTVPPPIPTGVSAVPGSRKVIISWDPTQDRDVLGHYVNISEIQGGPYSPYNAGVPTTCLSAMLAVTNLQPGKTYYFTVTAVDIPGNESDHSLEVSAIPTE